MARKDHIRFVLCFLTLPPQRALACKDREICVRR
jgi:hypothetical protein